MPPIPPSSGSDAPATLRQIAKLAGVSQMTVSRALGNRPRVAEETRRNVRRIAERLGYRPDPEITKLMHYLRRGVRPRFRSVICGLTNWPTAVLPPYFRALLAGAERQAESRGYRFDVEIVTGEARDGVRLQRILRCRGVEGVVLLPQRPPLDLSGLLDWREFSVVAASMSVLAPEVNRVAPHHFANVLRLCRELTVRGYRRIGLVIERGQDARVNHGFSAAVLSHGRHEAAEAVEPLVFNGTLRGTLEPWYRRERPDAIIATAESLVRECARLLRQRIPGPFGFASTNLEPGGTGSAMIGGIDESPGEIGALAVDLIASMVERRARGLPESPTSTLLAGRWRGGRSCRGKRGAAAALLAADPR